MDVQGALLAKLILHEDLRKAVDARITLDCFTDDQYQRIYAFLLKHWQEYGTPPDEAVVLRAFPAMTWEDSPQPTEYFLDAILRRRKRSILMEGLNEAAAFIHAENDPDAVDSMEAALQQALIQARLETSHSLDFDLVQSREEVMHLLGERSADPGHLRGISTGFHGIDYVTGGLQPEQFVVLIGTPKTFKSATALAITLAIHRQAKMPLFIGFEMSNTEQTDRTLSLTAGVSLTKIMNGTFSGKELRRIESRFNELELMRPLLFSSDITSAMTISGIQAKIQQFNPDVVIVDGAYMMQSELPKVEPGSAQAITSISRGLKRLAQAQRIPIIVTTQASMTRSKNGLSVGSAMYSQSWAQDADILLGTERVSTERQDDEPTGPVQVKLKVIESRSGPRKAVLLEWDWNCGSVEELDIEQQTNALNRKTNPSYANEDNETEWPTS